MKTTKNIVVKDGMTFDTKGKLILNITPEDWLQALKERRIIMNCTHRSKTNLSAVFKVYVIRHSEDGRYWLHHVFGKNFNEKRDGFVVKGLGFDCYIELLHTLSYQLGLDMEEVDKYQSNILRML